MYLPSFDILAPYKQLFKWNIISFSDKIIFKSNLMFGVPEAFPKDINITEFLSTSQKWKMYLKIITFTWMFIICTMCYSPAI